MKNEDAADQLFEQQESPTESCGDLDDEGRGMTSDATDYADFLGKIVLSEAHSTASPYDHTGILPWMGD